MISLYKKNKIFHMASMARSGETLVLKIFAIHPEIQIIHNLDKFDNKDSIKAFEFLKTYQNKTIAGNHRILKPFSIKRNQKILIKQGVWKHSYPFDGFVLSRNPVSIYSSLKVYDRKHIQYDPESNFWFENTNRLKRWLNDIDPSKVNIIVNKSPVEQFVEFYNTRMGNLLSLGLPIIRYEDLITQTEKTIEDLCSILGICMNNDLLFSHKFYATGKEGHGQNDLSKPIDISSLTKYKLNVTEDEFDFIAKNAYHVYRKYNYELNNGEVIYQ